MKKRGKNMRKKQKISNDNAETMHLNSYTFIYTNKTIRISTIDAYNLSTVVVKKYKFDKKVQVGQQQKVQVKIKMDKFWFLHISKSYFVGF